MDPLDAVALRFPGCHWREAYCTGRLQRCHFVSLSLGPVAETTVDGQPGPPATVPYEMIMVPNR